MSDKERLALDRWYNAQDEAESRELSAAEDPASPTDVVSDEIETLTSQLAAVTMDIQRIARENAALRRETGRLRQQLSEQAALQVT